MRYSPTLDRLLVLPDPEAEATKAGLLIPARARAAAGLPSGLVVAVGPGRPLADGTRFPVGVSAGQRVLYAPAAGTAVDHGNARHLLLNEADVFAVADDEPPVPSLLLTPIAGA